MSEMEEKCSVCGEELTRYGSKKLKDGVLCRNCAKLLSPWYEDADLEEKSVEDIREHLEYRKQNQEKLKDLKQTRTVEGKYSLYIDDDKGEFVLAKRKDLLKENPDIIALKDVQEMSVVEERYLDEDGVDIFFEAKIDSPQLRHLRMRVNEFPGIGTDTDEYRHDSELAIAYLDALADEGFEEVKEDLE